jgi:hypothetical protein
MDYTLVLPFDAEHSLSPLSVVSRSGLNLVCVDGLSLGLRSSHKMRIHNNSLEIQRCQLRPSRFPSREGYSRELDHYPNLTTQISTLWGQIQTLRYLESNLARWVHVCLLDGLRIDVREFLIREGYCGLESVRSGRGTIGGNCFPFFDRA